MSAKRRGLLRLVIEGPAYLGKAKFGGLGVDRCLLEGYAVSFDGVAFALEGGRERANGVGRGATKLRGEVGGDAD